MEAQWRRLLQEKPMLAQRLRLKSLCGLDPKPSFRTSRLHDIDVSSHYIVHCSQRGELMASHFCKHSRFLALMILRKDNYGAYLTRRAPYSSRYIPGPQSRYMETLLGPDYIPERYPA